MDGVNILNTIVEYTHNDLWCIIGWIAVIIGIISLILLLLSIQEYRITLIVISSIALIACFLTVAFSIYKWDTTATPYNTYQVTVDDDVSMNEFNDRYEVLSIDGKIYTVIDKEEENGQ